MKPIYKLLFVLLICAGICQISYFILSAGLRKYNVHKTERLNEILLGNKKFDVLFLGSSKTHTGINPRIVDSIAGFNSYNAGIEGGRINEFKMILDAYLENHPAPKALVLSVNLFEFDLRRPFFNYTQYFPYMGESKAVDRALNQYGHNTYALRYLPFLQLADFDDYTRSNALKGLAGKTEMEAGAFQYKGYLSNTNVVIEDKTLKYPAKQKAILSEGSLDLLKSIVDTCKKNSIALYFIYLPEYKHLIYQQTSNAGEIIKCVREQSIKHSIPLIRHDSLEICQNPTLFANPGHLNTAGANQYSIILAQQLKSTILSTTTPDER